MTHANYLDNLVEDDEEDGRVTITKQSDEVPDEGSPQKIKNFDEKADKDSSGDKTGFTNDHIKESLITPADFAENLENVAQLYLKIHSIKCEESEEQDSESRMMMLDYTDKLLCVKGNQLKVIARDNTHRFNKTAILAKQPEEERMVCLQLNKEDLLSLISNLDWKLFFSNNSVESFRYTLDLLEAFANGRKVNEYGEVSLFASFEYFKTRVAVDALLSTVSRNLDVISDFFNSIKDQIITSDTIAIHNTKEPSESEWIFGNKPSLIKLLKSVSVCLDLEEQLWISSRTLASEFDITKAHHICSRIHTSYGRLSSYTSFPSSKALALTLSEVGLINYSDWLPSLAHYMSPNTPLPSSIISTIYQDTKTLLTRLQENHPSNLMLKGLPWANVPLYKSINYQPYSSHCSPSITHVLPSTWSPFLATCDMHSGTVCLWDTSIHLNLVGVIEFKHSRALQQDLDQLKHQQEVIREQVIAKQQDREPERINLKHEKKDLGFHYDSDDQLLPSPIESTGILELPGLKELPSIGIEEETKKVEKKPEIVPNPKFLTDLINMGFSEKESKKALIDVKNESIELAVDKVFDNMNKLAEQQQIDLQETIKESLADGNSKTQEQIDTENEAKKQEELKQKELEEQQKKEELQQFEAEKEQEIAEIQSKLDHTEKQLLAIQTAEIDNFLMATSKSPSTSPILLACTSKQDDRCYLRLKCVSYHQKYLEKVKMNNIEETMQDYQFNINTLMPLFLGAQMRSNWDMSKSSGPLQIFHDSMSHKFEIKGIKKVHK